jgi:hypothetical protein
MAPIKAIETKYGGYRFRSRLEARWAVFFDHAEIEWEYEPEGYEVPTPTGTLRYLPDFWLECGQWAEVKGFLDVNGTRRLYDVACTLAECGQGNDLVVFGEVPRLHSALWPVQLHFEGRLWGVAWDPGAKGCPLYRPRVEIKPEADMALHLTQGFPFGIPDWADDALERARMARFEWGEHGG